MIFIAVLWCLVVIFVTTHIVLSRYTHRTSDSIGARIARGEHIQWTKEMSTLSDHNGADYTTYLRFVDLMTIHGLEKLFDHCFSLQLSNDGTHMLCIFKAVNNIHISQIPPYYRPQVMQYRQREAMKIVAKIGK